MSRLHDTRINTKKHPSVLVNALVVHIWFAILVQMARLYHLSLYSVICVSAVTTAWGVVAGDIKSFLIGPVVALSVWMVMDEEE